MCAMLDSLVIESRFHGYILCPPRCLTSDDLTPHPTPFISARDLDAARDRCARSLELNAEQPAAIMLLALIFTASGDLKGNPPFSGFPSFSVSPFLCKFPLALHRPVDVFSAFLFVQRLYGFWNCVLG